MQQLIEDNAQRPNITLCRIVLLVKDLRGHINRTAHTCFIGNSWVLDNFTEPEIAYLEISTVNEDVRRLQISVNNIVFSQLLISLDYLLHYRQYLTLTQTVPLSLLQIFLQIAIAAVLHYDVQTALAVQNLK
jgi:hypothetical protein